jgi:hypothetical protein
MKFLCKESNTKHTEWEPFNGPEIVSSIFRDQLQYWYRHNDGREAYILEDKNWLSVSISRFIFGEQ